MKKNKVEKYVDKYGNLELKDSNGELLVAIMRDKAEHNWIVNGRDCKLTSCKHAHSCVEMNRDELLMLRDYIDSTIKYYDEHIDEEVKHMEYVLSH